MRALTSMAHADVLHLVARSRDEGVTLAEITAELRCDRRHGHRILNALEDEGLIRGVPARGDRHPPRRGQPVRYYLNRDAVDLALATFRAHILGKTDLRGGGHVSGNAHT